jgi:AAA family ATP:ADP antiporter
MSDIYSSEQSLRLFGLFGAGASIGAVVGPSLPVLLGEAIGVYNLLLIAALMLLLIVPVIFYLDKHRATSASGSNDEATPASLRSIGGHFFGGFVDSTRAQYWGMMDLIVNTLAIATALFATSRLATHFGLAITLALVPVIMVFGWIAVAVAPGLALLVALQIVRRAGNYAITRPGREMLFTGVEPETRFKTKPVIDIVVYRGGDVVAGWTYTGLAQGVGLGLGSISVFAAAIALLWALVAIFLGNQYRKTSGSVKTANRVLTET